MAVDDVFVNRSAGKGLGNVILHNRVGKADAIERTLCAAVAGVDRIARMLRLRDDALGTNTDKGIQLAGKDAA